jgi:hypothetical protein
MAIEQIPLGLECRLYHNTSTYATPTWKEFKYVRDNTLGLESGEADVSSRANAGWRATVPTLHDGSLEFELLDKRTVTAGDDVEILQDAWLNRTPLEMAVMNGPINSVNSRGLRAAFNVMTFSRGEALEEGVVYSVSCKVAQSDNPPEFIVGDVTWTPTLLTAQSAKSGEGAPSPGAAA